MGSIRLDRSGEIDQHQGDGARAISMIKHIGSGAAGKGSARATITAHDGAATMGVRMRGSNKSEAQSLAWGPPRRFMPAGSPTAHHRERFRGRWENQLGGAEGVLVNKQSPSGPFEWGMNHSWDQRCRRYLTMVQASPPSPAKSPPRHFATDFSRDVVLASGYLTIVAYQQSSHHVVWVCWV